MKRVLMTITFAVGFALPAVSQTLPQCGSVPSTGLGIGGVARAGCNAMTAAQPGTHFYLETGTFTPNTLDGVVITITVPASTVTSPGRRPNCQIQSDWTEPEYADGLAIPEWPMGMWDGSSYTPTNTNPAPPSQTFRFRSNDALHGLEERSSYMVTVICTVRGP